MEKIWQCSSCENFYSEKFLDCPECDIPLSRLPTAHQGSHNFNNQHVVISGKNTGPIISKPTFTINSGSEVATYERKQIKHFQSLGSVLRPWLTVGFWASVVGCVEWLGNWASIFSAFGANQVQASTWTLMLIGLTAVYGSLAVIKIFNLSQLRVPNTWVRMKDRLYSSNENGSVDLYELTAKCPIKGCAGALRPQTPQENMEGVSFAALCSKHGIHHAFEFNDETHIGCRIKLTPKPKENNQR